MKGGWIGQIAGVSWGAPTEFKWQDKTIPADQMPAWRPSMINDAFGQDDLYVENVPAFARGVRDRCAELAGGDRLRQQRVSALVRQQRRAHESAPGRRPPDSSHPQFNKCPNDIDYQIEADYSGLIAPGMPQVAIDLGEKFGRLMNYGDGVRRPIHGRPLCRGVLRVRSSQARPDSARRDPGAEPIRGDGARHDCVVPGRPEHWEKAWRLCQKKYREDKEYQKLPRMVASTARSTAPTS